MKKVLFTATVDSHIKQFHIPYLKFFKEQGYEVHVATNGDEEIPYCDKKHKISFERNPFKVNNIKAIKQLKKIIDNENFNIIHCHTPMGSVITRIAAIKARKNGTKVIYTAHGFHFYKGAPILNWCLYYPIEKLLSKYTDTLITMNKEDYELAKKNFKKCKDIQYVLGVGIDEKKFNFKLSNEERHILRSGLEIKDDDYVIIYVAELSKRKNQSMAIYAMQELVKDNKNIKLLFVGKDSYKGKYQKLVRKVNLENNIIFAGYRKDVPKIMKMSNLAISTAKQEGLPVNIMEAMASNLPIIATDCRGNRDLIEKENLVPIGDTKELIKHIKEIMINEKKCYQYNSISNYYLDNVKSKMTKIYEAVEHEYRNINTL